MSRVLLVAMCVVFCVGIFSNAPSCEEYALTTVVVEVDYDTDTVVCVDSTGNAWEFEGCEDWRVDDVCSMVMCDKGTDNIVDDEIVSVRYSAYTVR